MLNAFQKWEGKFDEKVFECTVVVLSNGAKATESTETSTGKRVTITGNSVNIRLGNSTAFGVIACVDKGTSYEYVATAENGWNAIVIGDKVGWVSGKYSKAE